MGKPKAREVFLKDLEDASRPSSFPDITDVKHGSDHGTVSFKYSCDSLPLGGVVIQALIPELSEYPKSHVYMLYTSDENVPPSFASGLANIQDSLEGLGLSQMLEKLSRHFGKLPAARPPLEAAEESETEDWDGDVDDDDDEPMDDEQDDDDEVWPESPKPQIDAKNGFRPVDRSPGASKTQKAQIRADLRAVKAANFKVGIIGDIMNAGANVYLAISIRVSKLGIPDEALQAWNVDRRRYLVLLLHFPSGYRDVAQLIEDDKFKKSGDRATVFMRVGLCHSYKPSRAATVQAFTSTVKNETPNAKAGANQEQINDEHKLHLMFLSKSLRGLLEDRLVKIMRYRLSMGFGWGGAELFYNENQCKAMDQREVIDAKYYEEDDSSSMLLPEFLNSDHMTEAQGRASFPALAMQFVLRHFVRCTEFCLVCHCKVKADFEALKPYVCGGELCLYQYLQLGFGPSVEWEILSQPYVVDLLVSFCYTSAGSTDRLKDFPKGLRLEVPPVNPNEPQDSILHAYHAPSYAPIQATHLKAPDSSQSDELLPKGLKAKFDAQKLELIFPDRASKCPLKENDWIIIQDPFESSRELHCRVMDTSLYPTVKIGKPNPRGFGTKSSSTALSTFELDSGPSGHDVTFNIYNRNFDALSDDAKRKSIRVILDTLPDVQEMKNYLLRSQLHRAEPSLSHWNQRISGTALNLLRWIIASNRSCLLQVDDIDVAEKDKDTNRAPASMKEERVHGMGQWMQFRFAQGAPDKEQRFVTAVNSTAARLDLSYPTIFAWHGSPLGNWHGIIREGLHFKESLHGRAYGHGVYMSNHSATSIGYSNMAQAGSAWPHSKLKVTQALALNEVVNAPAEFLCRNPHYVVQHVDWIQTRYLFVKCGAVEKPLLPESDQPKNAFSQDPSFPVTGETGRHIIIPATAVSMSRRTVTSPRSSRTGDKKVKVEVETNGEQAQQEDDDANSVVTNWSDKEVFFESDDDELRVIPKDEFQQSTKAKDKEKAAPPTDFVENFLDITTLPMLAPPSYANTMATKALQRALTETIKVQEMTPLHELGWYINADHITNMYQWIIELHTFDPKLPLAVDMKAKNVKSVVLELRFTSNYPFAPPFVRVIRPRFLPFLAGGGGHVTAGGALCMELLTSSGWSAVNNIESVLLQVRMAMSSTEPKPARLDNRGGDYGIGEAVEAFTRACMVHGWQVPEGLASFGREIPVGHGNESGLHTGLGAFDEL